jgi:hypothetical protein
MTTDVYPRENCIAPAMVFIVWTTDTTNGRGLFSRKWHTFSLFESSD